MADPRIPRRRAAGLALAAALACAPALLLGWARAGSAEPATSAQPADAPPMPTRVAIIPFKCDPACTDLPRLQRSLVDRLVDKATFELLMTQEMEDLLLERRDFRTAMDSLIARVTRGLTPDSATAALLARRFRVDGFLYAHMGLDGPSVAVWALAPRARDVYNYHSARDTQGFLPDAQHEGAQTKGTQYNTGGAAPGSSGGGGSPSGGSGGGGGKSTGDPSAELPTQYTKDIILVGTSTDSDERLDSIAETVSNALHKILHPNADGNGHGQ